jgi:DNA gyrase subunit B
MPEIVERGHIYIAQPPLYKVKKGKQERYIKDDPGLTEYLTTLALEKASLHVNPNAPGISGLSLESLVKQYYKVNDIIANLSRKIPTELLERMIYHKALTVANSADQAYSQNWLNEFIEKLEIHEADGGLYSGAIVEDHERNLFTPKITIRKHGIDHDYHINHDFITSADYEKIGQLGEAISELLEEGAFVQRGDKSLPVTTFVEAVEWLLSESKRGLYIQRYKGLGEMNPEQLWETTMDPDARRMLQVTIEDAIGADQLFTCLMGDHVEPRREFIEKNALKVANLDV